MTLLSVQVHNIILPDLLEPASKFLLGQLNSRLLDLAGGLGLATSDRGQVAYLSVLESLTIKPQCMYKWQVFLGWLQYEGETYAYISGTGRSHLADILNFREVSTRDYSSDRLHMKPVSETHNLWMHSVEDNHLLVY
ncbi:hypothetical protein DPV78_011649 [Talaromyces pinophilus]|nr:hypothetical protein DPV78_011649 [Talaromyces pinophilus]